MKSYIHEQKISENSTLLKGEEEKIECFQSKNQNQLKKKRPKHVI